MAIVSTIVLFIVFNAKINLMLGDFQGLTKTTRIGDESFSTKKGIRGESTNLPFLLGHHLMGYEL